MKKLLPFIILIIVGCSNKAYHDSNLLDMHNDARRHSHLKPLRNDPHLAKAAQNHAEWMAANNKLSHTGKWKSAPWDRAKVAGAHFNEVGENIAYGGTDSNEIFEMWMESSGHRANILNKEYQFVGFGMAEGQESTFWCAVFGGDLQVE